MGLTPGTKLGPYEIVSPIGAGGMGEVYRARDIRLGRDVAVKVLPPGFAADPDRLRRFEHEARTVGGLNHPNLVTLFDVGTHEGSPYLVMELLEGETLRQKLGGKPLSVRRAVEIASAIAEGVSTAHDRGVIHRDLKPENLFLTRDGRLKILDFGLAKLQEKPRLAELEDAETLTKGQRAIGTDSGTVLGTVGYMSPEQVRGETLDARSDIFALGIILWEMLTGDRPFRGSSAVESLHAILKDEPPDLDPALKLPPVLEQIVHTCLAKNPSGRFHSAHDLSFALSHLPGSTPSGISSQQAIPGTPRLWLWALGLGVAASLVIAFFLGRWLTSPPLLHVKRLTPSPRIISSARFLPDGKSIVYTAAPDGADAGILGELFRLSPGEAPVHLGVLDCRVLDVSTTGDLILVWRKGANVGGGKEAATVLARVPAAGGTAPRIVEEEYVDILDSARWAQDGHDLIIKHRRYKGKPTTQVITYQGRILYEVPYGFGLGRHDLGLNDKGDAIRFIEWRGRGVQSFVTVGLDGRVINRTSIKELSPGSVFPFRGHLVVLSVRDGPENPAQLVQLSPFGAFEKVLHNLPTDVELWDVSPKGELLLTQGGHSWISDLRWQEPDSEQERVLDFGSSYGRPVLNSSGSQLSCRASKDGTENVFLLQTRQLTATNLGQGEVVDQAPDGKTLLSVVTDPNGFSHLRLLSSGAGPPRDLPGEWIHCWHSLLLPGGKVFIYGRQKEDIERHAYFVDPEGTSPQRLNWNVASIRGPVSPDGQAAFAVATTESDPVSWSRVNLATGVLTSLPSTTAGMDPVGWNESGDGVWLIREASKEHSFPSSLWRCSLETGRLEKVREIAGPAYPLASLQGFRITPDGRSYAYSFVYDVPARKDLFQVTGLLR